MRLTSYTDYALRVLMYLGLEPGRIATIPEIAAAYGISENHLMKIVRDLGQLGLIETLRGRSGGMRLSRDPDRIVLGEVVRSLEPDFHLVECFDAQHNSCVITGTCRLQSVLGDALRAYFDVLDSVSLADLLRNKPDMARKVRLTVGGAANSSNDRSRLG